MRSGLSMVKVIITEQLILDSQSQEACLQKDCSQDAIDIVHLADEVFRNHSFFVGSPQGGARLARTLTIIANCKAYNIDPYKYLCDVFRRIKTTAKDQLVNLVAHKWQPQMAPAIY